MTKNPMLTSIEIETSGQRYNLPFLPDAGIPDTPQDTARWRGFIESLSPRTRLGEDPESGKSGIFYRHGEWLGDLVFADDVTSIFVIEDRTAVRGSVVARNARTRNRLFDHAVAVLGDLEVHGDMLRQTPPPFDFQGDLVLSRPRRMDELTVPPERLAAWGLDDSRLLRLGDGTYAFVPDEESGAGMLRNVLNGAQFIWEGSYWEPVRGSKASRELQRDVADRLDRLSRYVGLGHDFILHTPKKIGHNVRKILRFMDFLVAAAYTDEDPGFLADLSSCLMDLEAGIYADEVDEANIRLVLDTLTDGRLEDLRKLIARPRERRPDEHLRNDVARLRALLEEELTVDALFPTARSLLLFLLAAFKAQEARQSALRTVETLSGALDAATRGLGMPGRLGILDILRDPAAVMQALRAKVVKATGGVLASVQDELGALAEIKPKTMLRQVLRALQTQGIPDAAEPDVALIMMLDRFRGGLDALPLDKAGVLDLVSANLMGPAIGELARVRAWVTEGRRADGMGVQVMMHRLNTASASDFVRHLLRRVGWEYSVVRRYNETTGAGRRAAEAMQRSSGIGLPSDMLQLLLNRLNRICLLCGLGKNFLEQGIEATTSNLERLRAFVDMCPPHMVHPAGDTRAEKCKALLRDFSQRLGSLRDNLAAGQAIRARSDIEALSEEYAQALRIALSVERRRVNASAIYADIQVLERLGQGGLQLADILGPTDKALYFLNTGLGCAEGKAALYPYVKPINDVLAGLVREGLLPFRVSILDLLLHLERTVLCLRRKSDSPALHAGLDRIVEEALRLRSIPVASLVSLPLVALDGKEGEGAARDRDLLNRLRSFGPAALADLGLRPGHMVLLLSLHLESGIAADARLMLNRGEFEGLPPQAVLDAILGRLKSRESVVSAYNALARR